MISVSDEQLFELHQPSDNAGFVYAVMILTKELGYSNTETALISTAASELSTNIIKYAGSGMIYLRAVTDADKTGIEIEAVDNGPGIPDIEMAMRETYSTGKSLGLGLPSVKRLMDEFIIESENRKGTIVKVRKWRTGQ